MPKDSSQRRLLSKIGNILLTHRTISSQETAFRLLGLEMVYSSRETVFVKTTSPDQRFSILKSKKKLEELPSGSFNVFANGVPQYYMARPRDSKFESMTLSEFVTNAACAQPRISDTINGETTCIM